MAIKYKNLSSFNNTYPTTKVNFENNFESIAGSIIRRAKEDSISFDKKNVDDIKSYDKVSFRFIVRLETGEEWTSKSLKDDLERALHVDSNPYFNRFTVPIVELNSTELTSYPFLDKFNAAELYAEVNVEETISSIEKLLLHIDWLVKQEPIELRSTKLEKELKDGTPGIGKWNVHTDPDGKFGMEYADLLKSIGND
jgi:hypothetical protein